MGAFFTPSCGIPQEGVLFFEIEASDGVELISRGRHERFVIDKAKFDGKLKEKIEGKRS